MERAISRTKHNYPTPKHTAKLILVAAAGQVVQRLAVVARVVAHLLVVERAELVEATVRDRDALELLVHQLLALLEQLLWTERPINFQSSCT